MSQAPPLPVYLLTGFLGSGKTTLLARLIHQPAFADTAVIINEFGDVGLDHVLLEKSDDRDVVLLESGCLCCASNSPLQDSLEDLYYRRLRGDIPAFSRVVVETSGLADPLPLMNAINASATVSRQYRFAGVVTVVDAVNGAASLREYRECAVQLAVADRVVLTKTDVASAAETEAVRGLIAQANPQADVLPVTLDSEIDLLRGLEMREHAPVAPVAGQAAGKFSHLLRYGITSHVLRVNGPVGWPRYAAWVGTAQRVLGERLLRAKGILEFEDGEVCAIHGVRHLFGTPRPLSGPVPAPQCGAVVLITSDVDEEDIETVARALGATVMPQAVLAAM
ncbi:MAG TPA: GTP-binding protein [Bordetella sp.]